MRADAINAINRQETPHMDRDPDSVANVQKLTPGNKDVKSTLQEPKKLNSAALIESLLGLNPRRLASIETQAGRDHDAALLGLGVVMRRVLETTIALGGRQRAIVRLTTAATADDWSDAKTANMASLFTWALVRPYRRQRNLPFAPLSTATDGGDDRPVEIPQSLRKMSVDELVEAILAPAASVDWRNTIDEPATHPVSVAGMIGAALGLDPSLLRFYRTDVDVAADPEAHAGIGLELLARDVLAQYKVMRERRTTAVRLCGEADARDAMIPEARAVQIATLLAASLHAADHEVFFLAPRQRSSDERAMLREAAKVVYRDGCDEARRGLELICDGIVHFGHDANWTIADRLLAEVAPEVDPHRQAMPYCVAMQTALGGLATG